jgi:hypothetical protein
MTDDEEFYAWLDGELDGADADRVAARVASDPVLTALAARHRAMAADLRGAFDPVASQDVPPPRFASANVADFDAKRAQRRSRSGRPISVATQWAAMAATLVIGFVAGTTMPSGADGPVTRENGALVASADLEDALYSQLASVAVDSGPRIGLTFRDRSGSICRSFSEESVSGLACRADGDWKIRGLFQGGGQQSGDYRMAAGEDPRLAGLIDERIAGEPFDAAAERTAQEQGWR